jgi:glycosyltransferase involved in cell wall biosynthesis
MRILFLTNGPITNAGPRSRVFQYLPHFERDGIAVRVIEAALSWPTRIANRLGDLPNGTLSGAVGRGVLRGALRGSQAANLGFAEMQATRASLITAWDFDLLFAQGVLLHPALVDLLHHRGKHVVYDFVDPIWLKSGPLQRLDRFHQLLPRYDLLVLGTTYTQEYVIQHGARRPLVLIGPIDTQLYQPQPRSSRPTVTIGWVGSSTTTRYFEAILQPLVEICRRHPQARILTVGANRLTAEGLPLEQRSWSLNREPSDLGEIDVGIMPLDDDDWCRGKGGYKLLQYMAAGLPCVASPVGVNEQILVHGTTGYHARSATEWVESLSTLIQRADLRTAMGSAGRLRAETEYSFDVSYPRLKAALQGLK